MIKIYQNKLAIFILCIVLILEMAGCGPKKSNTAQNSPGTQDGDEQVIIIGDSFFKNNLDPALDYNGWYAIEYGLGETLVKLNHNMELEPWLPSRGKN